MTSGLGRAKMSPDMRFDVILLRVVFAAFLISAGYYLVPIKGYPLVSAGAAALIAVAVVLFEMRIRRASLKTLIGAAVGSILGIIGAYLIGTLISHQHATALGEPVKTFLTLALTFF